MRLRRMLLVLAAAVTISGGIWQTVPAYAATAAPAAHPASSQAYLHPNNSILSTDLQVFSDCAEFSGQISVFHITTPEDIFWEFNVNGGIVVHCAGGTAQLYAYWTCDGVSDGALLGSTTSSERITESPESCDVPSTRGHVLLCYASSAGGACVASGDV